MVKGSGSGKQYVTVQVTHYADGETVPVLIFYPGGRVFHIWSSRLLEEKTKDYRIEQQTYEIVVNGQKTKLYCEDGRWSVQGR
ncbi:MAG: hypothetical protein IJ091_10670 [Oscillospiraceae bacterium]|nr:hypothetical protein [Oscillospiraceae bacterium]